MILENMYVFFVAIGLSLLYFVLSYCLARFFEWERPTFPRGRTVRSLLGSQDVSTGDAAFDAI